MNTPVPGPQRDRAEARRSKTWGSDKEVRSRLVVIDPEAHLLGLRKVGCD